jgi:hypothetical protein
MAPSEARQEHDKKLLKITQEQLGNGVETRIFESAEGSLTPLTLSDSQATAKKLSAAISGGTSAS